MLKRNYFFEFAGMPQSGKSTIVEIVAHFLKRQGHPIGEYRGGSRYSPLYNSPIAELNLWLACKAAEFVVGAGGTGKELHKIFLLDRGLIDRCIFTETLLRRGMIKDDAAQRITNFLTLPELLQKIDGVFIFITSPEIALERENMGKITEKEGDVMNFDFLATMRSAVIDGYTSVRDNMGGVIQNIHLFDTEQYDRQTQQIAEPIADNILDIIDWKKKG